MTSNKELTLMLKKLDDLYNKEESIKKAIINLSLQYEQIKHDIEFQETKIMHYSNSINRLKQVAKNIKKGG